MIGYLTVGTNDFEQGIAFYDALFSALGIKRLWTVENMAGWGVSRDQTAFCLAIPFDGQEATIGNGSMVALKVKDRESVKRVHEKALALGGTNEGDPAPRGDHGVYAAYFRDLDGNKLNAYVPAIKVQ